jgi:hypothetical protein
MQLTPTVRTAGQRGVNNAFRLVRKTAATGTKERGGGRPQR